MRLGLEEFKNNLEEISDKQFVFNTLEQLDELRLNANENTNYYDSTPLNKVDTLSSSYRILEQKLHDLKNQKLEFPKKKEEPQKPFGCNFFMIIPALGFCYLIVFFLINFLSYLFNFSDNTDYNIKLTFLVLFILLFILYTFSKKDRAATSYPIFLKNKKQIELDYKKEKQLIIDKHNSEIFIQSTELSNHPLKEIKKKIELEHPTFENTIADIKKMIDKFKILYPI